MEHFIDNHATRTWFPSTIPPVYAPQHSPTSIQEGVPTEIVALVRAGKTKEAIKRYAR